MNITDPTLLLSYKQEIPLFSNLTYYHDVELKMKKLTMIHKFFFLFRAYRKLLAHKLG